MSVFEPLPASVTESRERRGELGGRLWRRAGNRSACLYVHGIESHSEWFRGPAALLAAGGVDVWAFDRRGSGLSAFPGIGLAISRDGERWEKYDENPILSRSGKDGDPDAVGVAGGSVIQVRLPDGGSQWRFYYTGCPTLGEDLFLSQQKRVCLAVSQDALRWRKRGAIMLRDPNRDYENVGVAGPVVRQQEDGTFRMWYSAIGTKWGYYSICYAESDDGIHWRRGQHYGENLQLAPQGNGWEKQMVEYPSIVEENGNLRLFYCGNGYGRTGIGTATSR